MTEEWFLSPLSKQRVDLGLAPTPASGLQWVETKLTELIWHCTNDLTFGKPWIKPWIYVVWSAIYFDFFLDQSHCYYSRAVFMICIQIYTAVAGSEVQGRLGLPEVLLSWCVWHCSQRLLFHRHGNWRLECFVACKPPEYWSLMHHCSQLKHCSSFLLSGEKN